MAVAGSIEGRVKAAKSGKKTVAGKKPRSTKGGIATRRATTKTATQEEPLAAEAKPVEQSDATMENPQGEAELWKSVNKQVALKADSIAKGLADMAAEGNPACARLLVDMLSGKTLSLKKLKRALSHAEDLMRDEPWKGPEKQETKNRE